MTRTFLFPAIGLLVIASAANAFDIPGDMNNDGRLDEADWPALAACVTGPFAGVLAPCEAVDVNEDGAVDLADWAYISRHWLASNCEVTAAASSLENNDFPAAYAVDGDNATRWASAWEDNQWLELDFGHQRQLHGLTIRWEAAFATGYTVSLSTDGSDWTPVFSTTSGNGGDDVIAFAPQAAQYIRVDCASRALEYGFSIWEVAVESDDECYLPDLDEEAFIDLLVSSMTLEEKTSYVYGETTFSLRSIPRLGIPVLNLADGPLGIRNGQGTAFPATIALASSWDVDLVERFGEAIGREYRNKGQHVWLGPCMNIVRVPHGGRNFETYGEDPYLNSRMAVAAINGAQSQHVVACAKHFACNNQEYERFTINVQVDERVMREIYLPSFKAAVTEANAWAVMSAYNRLNGPYCTASSFLQQQVLKDEWGFKGFVVSDWDAVHETVVPANAGLDLEMDLGYPTGRYWGNGQLLAAVQNGQVSEATVDDKVRRILRAVRFTGIMDEPWPAPNVEPYEHRSVARELAANGMVLLKNDGNVLPLDKNAPQTIAVIGPNYNIARTGAGGSSEVSPYRTVSPIEGLREAAGPDVTFVEEMGVLVSDSVPPAINTAYLTPSIGAGSGLYAEYFNNENLSGSPVLTRVDPTIDFEWEEGSPGAGVAADHFSVRWSGTLTVPLTAAYTLVVATDDGVRLWLDGNLVVDDWNGHATVVHQVARPFIAGHAYDLVVEYFEGEGLANAKLGLFNMTGGVSVAAQAAANADAALVFVGLSSAVEGEGYDRGSYGLDSAQRNLINAVSAANPNTAIVVIAGSQVITSDWVDQAPAILQAWYPGQEEGHALADVIFGDVNPGAKLPMTFVREWSQHPAYTNYPGGQYTEGLFIGYRHYDANDIEPMFPFGHGLSYTTFAYTNLTIDDSDLAASGTVHVALEVQNTGSRAGAEVVQLYVRDVASSVVRPVKELKRFAKVLLQPGESTTVDFEIDRAALSYYDVNAARWVAEPGEFEIQVGASSRDIRLTESFILPAE